MGNPAKLHYFRGAIFAMVLCCQGIADAGLAEGVAAYKRGDYVTALREFRALADQGYADGQNNLGLMYANGQGVPKDDQQAVFWYRKAGDQGGDAAQCNLGNMYVEGRGVPKDDQQAVLWYRKAADQGNARAQFNLGNMYGEGRGVPKDDQQAVFWYRKAADQGHADAQFNLGTMYGEGQGVPKVEQQTVFWYRKAADQGLADAQYNLGNMYREGRGVPKDDQQAVFWYRKAADQGHAAAQIILGWMHDLGRGVPKDDQQAVSWYRKAAGQGDARAQSNLGNMYREGRGAPKDDQQAAFWYRKAADQGHARAQFNLGNLYGEGRGVPKDEQQAYFWSLLASAQGHENAIKLREFLEPLLTSTQRVAAQTAARNWKPTVAGTPGSGSPAIVAAPTTPATPTPSPARPESTGSGFAVAAGRLVTNAHVVEGCIRVMVAGQGTVTVLAVDKRSDLALLSTNANNASFASLRAGRLRQGDAVTVVGFPLRGLLATGAQVTTGNVSALAGMQNDTRFIQISAPVQPGNSGGPLVDGSGNVAGVVVSKLNAMKIAEITGDIPQNVNFAISPLVLQGFLDANGVNYQSAPSNKNLSTADVADIAKRYTVLVECWR